MYLEICDGTMEEGSLRCDANVSVRLRGTETLGKKVEVKNMNSFRNLGHAIDFEYQRQVGLLELGHEIISETRSFDADGGFTSSMRTKEELNDYRYFPDPDLPPVLLTEEWIQSVSAQLPALPNALYRKFIATYGLPRYDAALLTESKEVATWFEALCTKTKFYKAASNWMMGPIKSYLNETGTSFLTFPLEVEVVAQLIALVEEGQVSFSVASQKIYPELILNPTVTPLAIAQQLNLIQESDASYLVPLAKEVLLENPDKVKEFKSGKKGLLGLFMGELMKKSGGKADPKVASRIFSELLAN
jgi:aspartyl-tRNA(Asn)/glutamyl-tRNA(Gln) amidotransferase subunit B